VNGSPTRKQLQTGSYEMKKLLTISALLTITLGLIVAGCANENAKKCKGGAGCGSGQCKSAPQADKLCTSCGQVKGSEECCDDNAE